MDINNLTYFQRQQEKLMQLSQRTRLSYRVIDTSERSVESIAAEMLVFWRV